MSRLRLADVDEVPARSLHQVVVRSRQFLLKRFDETPSEELHRRLLRHALLLLRLQEEEGVSRGRRDGRPLK